MANNQPKRRLEATLRLFMAVGDAPICHQLYSMADNTYVGTTPQNTDGRISYIFRPRRRPSSRSRSQDIEAIAASFLHLSWERRRRPMTSTLAFLPKTNVAVVRGSKPACHLHTYLDRTNAPMTKSMMSGAAGTHWCGRTNSCYTRSSGGA